MMYNIFVSQRLQVSVRMLQSKHMLYINNNTCAICIIGRSFETNLHFEMK